MADPIFGEWAECSAKIKHDLPPANLVSEVNWPQEYQKDPNAFDDDTFNTNTPFTIICPGQHCTESVNQSAQAHLYCSCKDVNGHDIPNCTPAAMLSPFRARICLSLSNPGDKGNWAKGGRVCTACGSDYFALTCYCCCSCFANGTRISVPNGQGVTKIEDFKLRDKVLAGGLDSSGALKLNWSTRLVNFSQGTGEEGHQPEMVFVHFGNNGQMVVTPDHLFLLPSGKLKRADRLVPGIDQFVDKDGNPVDLHEVALGAYDGGVHHIATDADYTGDLNGHLLISEGVVTGDFNLQIHSADLKQKNFLEDGQDDLPRIGTAEYEAANPDLGFTNVATVTNPGSPDRPSTGIIEKFYHDTMERFQIPAGAAKFLSDPQARDVEQAALKPAFSDFNHNIESVSRLLRTFSGHYPKIKFHLLTGHNEVNGFAYVIHGQQHIAISHGIIRLRGMGTEGVSMILFHLINRLNKITPPGTDGWTSVAMSDYYGGISVPQVYGSGRSASTLVTEGVDQLQKVLFDQITDANKNYAGDPFNPSTGIRVEAFNNGFDGVMPPKGIGGPEDGTLQVLGASVARPIFTADSFVSVDISPEVAAEFLQALQDAGILDGKGQLQVLVTKITDLSFISDDDRETVRHILRNAPYTVSIQFTGDVGGNFLHPVDFPLTPAATVTSVSDLDHTVILKANLALGTKYTVNVSHDVRSVNTSTLDPNKDSASFTA